MGAFRKVMTTLSATQRMPTPAPIARAVNRREGGAVVSSNSSSSSARRLRREAYDEYCPSESGIGFPIPLYLNDKLLPYRSVAIYRVFRYTRDKSLRYDMRFSNSAPCWWLLPDLFLHGH